MISSCICFFLELNSNQDMLIIIGALSFSSFIIYILWIIFIPKDKAYALLIINSKGNPEKINNSYIENLFYCFYACKYYLFK